MMFGRASLIPNLISLTNKTSSNRAATLADGVLLYLKIMDYAREIKASLTLPDIASHYGFTPNRQGRIPRPFHNGKDPNLGLKDRYYNCFVCGAKGDAIKFVQELFGLNFQDAISKLNDDFCLGFPIGQRIDRRKQLEMERLAFQRRQKAKQEEAERQQIDDAYWAAFDEWALLFLTICFSTVYTRMLMEEDTVARTLSTNTVNILIAVNRTVVTPNIGSTQTQETYRKTSN